MKALGLAALAACHLIGATGVQARQDKNVAVAINDTSESYAGGRESISFNASGASAEFAPPSRSAGFGDDVRDQILKACAPKDRVNTPLSAQWRCRREDGASLRKVTERRSAGS